MTATDDRVLDTLTRANPYPRDSLAEASEDPRAQAILTAILDQPAPSQPVPHGGGGGRRSGWRVLAPVLSLVVVAAVVAVALHVGAGRQRARL